MTMKIEEGRAKELLSILSPKQKAKLSIAYFARYYLGVVIPKHQNEWFHALQDNDRLVLLSPRNHGKTHTVARVYVEWLCLYNPDIRILLFGKSKKQSMKSLRLVHNDFKHNQKFRQDFPEELRYLHKTDNMIFLNEMSDNRDATIEACGIYSSVTGSHFDFIVCDDLVDDDNTRTPYMMEMVSGWFKGTVTPLIEFDGSMVVIGTRKHFNDLYSELVSNPRWKVHKDQAILDMPKPDEYAFFYDENGDIDRVEVYGDFEVLWPERWAIEDLLLMKEDVGSIYFNREYQNDPSGLQGQLLNTDWLNYYDWKEVWDEEDNYLIDMEIYQAWDLALGKTQTGDFCVCITFGITKDQKMYVLDIWRGQVDFPTQVKKVIELAEQYDPVLIGIESNVYQLALPQMVNEIAFLPIKPIISLGNKEQSIIATSVHYENGRVFLPDWHWETDNLKREYVQFPKGKNDDIIDCMKIGFGLAQLNRASIDPYQIVGAGSVGR